jgi:UDP-N-acetylglucosamine:LPS N-acetylglucosamine transferase
MVRFYSWFIMDYIRKAATSHTLKKKGVQFTWRCEHQSGFESLKQVLCEALVLQIPDFNKEFVLEMDASDLAISYYSYLLMLT